MEQHIWRIVAGIFLLSSLGCQGLRTFPMAARAGDTITGFMGGTGKTMTTETTTVSMYPVSNPATKYYPYLRSIFYVYPDPTSKVANYQPSPMINTITGGDLYQGIAVMDLPLDVLPGSYTVELNGKAGISKFNLDIIPGVGQSDDFSDISWTPQDISTLEPAPQKKIYFDIGYTVGAVDLQVYYDTTVIAPTDINVVSSKFNQGAGTFENFQNMLFWREQGGVLHINILCPRGVSSQYIQLAIIYPEGVATPGIGIDSFKCFDLNGNVISGIQAH